jgi:thioredoxin 1
VSIHEIDNVEKNVKERGATIVDFYGSNCPACLSIQHLLEIVSEQFGDQIAFLKLNVDTHMDQAKKLGVRSLPTLVFFNSGEEVGRHTGLISRNSLNARLGRLLDGQ